LGFNYEDAGDEKNFLIASPEKALCDIAATQTHIATQKGMKESLELMRLDFSFYEKLNFPLLEEIKAGYRRQRLKLLINCLKDSHV